MSWALSGGAVLVASAEPGETYNQRRRRLSPLIAENDYDDEDDEEEEEDDDSFVVDDDDMLDEPGDQFPPLDLDQVLLYAGRGVLGNGAVELRESTIPGAGLGVFAGRDIAAGQPITLYYGQLIDKAEADRRKSIGQASHIVPLVQFTWYIDGRRHPSGRRIRGPRRELVGRGLGAYCNSTRGVPGAIDNARFESVDTGANLRIVARDPAARASLDPRLRTKYVRAIRDIPAGTEILVEYGLV